MDLVYYVDGESYVSEAYLDRWLTYFKLYQFYNYTRTVQQRLKQT